MWIHTLLQLKSQEKSLWLFVRQPDTIFRAILPAVLALRKFSKIENLKEEKEAAIPGSNPRSDVPKHTALTNTLRWQRCKTQFESDIYTCYSLVALGSPLGLHCKLGECCLALESQQCVNSTSHAPNARCARSLAGAFIIHRPASLAYLDCRTNSSENSIRLPDE